jgi:O-antigen/teichoic acid export membrane protein
MIQSTHTPTAPEAGGAKRNTTKKHIRNSSLLLSGRFISMGISLLVQILTVRYLAKSDYGAFAYTLAIASFGSSIAVFGLDKTITRFAPIYHEQREYNKLFGSLVLTLSTVATIGILLVVLTFGLQRMFATALADPQTMALMLIVIFIVPLDALDTLFEGIFAIFASPRTIFVRRHLLGPGLKLAAVLLLILVKADVYFLAVGYLLATLVGVLTYLFLLVKLLRQQDLLQYVSWRSLQLPVKELFGFSLPLLSSDLVFMLRSYLPVILLEYLHSTAGVAAFRAVVPVARLNMIVYQSFTFLYMPYAARMFARNERQELNDLYWRSAIWIAIFSFPIFVVSCSLAQPFTVFLFSNRYAESGLILALLSLGNYVNAAFGFNTHTLRVYGKVRTIVILDTASVIVGAAASFLLIARYGALGAAISTSLTMIVQNLLYQIALQFGTDVKIFDPVYRQVYLSIICAGGSVFLVQWLLAPSIYISFGIALLASLAVLLVNRKVLTVEQIFPELLRIPFVKHLLVTAPTIS